MSVLKDLLRHKWARSVLRDPSSYPDETMEAKRILGLLPKCPTCKSDDPNFQDALHYVAHGECHDPFHLDADGG